MPYVKTSLMTLGLAERKERRFGRGRPPNTITVAINCRKDGEERQDSHGKEWKEGGRGSSQRGRPSPPFRTDFFGSSETRPTHTLQIAETRSHFISQASPPESAVCLGGADFCKTSPSPLQSDRRGLFRRLSQDLSNGLPSSFLLGLVRSFLLCVTAEAEPMRAARPLAPPLRVEPRMHDARHASAVEGHSGFCRNLSALTLAVPPLLLLSHFGRRLRLQTSFAMLLVNQVHLGDRHRESTE